MDIDTARNTFFADQERKQEYLEALEELNIEGLREATLDHIQQAYGADFIQFGDYDFDFAVAEYITPDRTHVDIHLKDAEERYSVDAISHYAFTANTLNRHIESVSIYLDDVEVYIDETETTKIDIGGNPYTFVEFGITKGE